MFNKSWQKELAGVRNLDNHSKFQYNAYTRSFFMNAAWIVPIFIAMIWLMGFAQDTLAIPFIWLLHGIHGVGIPYVWCIILMSWFVYIVLTSVYIVVERHSNIGVARKALLQPYIKMIEAYCTHHKTFRMTYDKLIRIYYRANHATGSLPLTFFTMIIQMPIFVGLAASFKSDPTLLHSHVGSMRLADTVPLLAVMAALFYVVNALYSMHTLGRKITKSSLIGPGLTGLIMLTAVMSTSVATSIYLLSGAFIVTLRIMYLGYKRKAWNAKAIANFEPTVYPKDFLQAIDLKLWAKEDETNGRSQLTIEEPFDYDKYIQEHPIEDVTVIK